jgi:pilus assembly protein Flp/PilA
MNTLIRYARRFGTEEGGATAVEYAIMLALIIIVCMSAIATLGTKVSSTYVDVEASLP